MKTRVIPFCLLVAVLLWAALQFGPRTHAQQEPAGPTQAEWTILLYMDADNDLELDQMDDLKEMVAAGSTKDVNIVVLADRNPKGDGEKYFNGPIANLANWTSAKLLYVEKGKLRELADWGEADMGDPATLKKFLETGSSMYPAKHYAVIMEDHGTGWPGACADESNGDNMLTTQEIGTVLTDASKTTGKFELIGFDACLMANLEVAKAVAPAGHFMIASEELEPGSGWSYTELLNALNGHPQMTGDQLGRIIVDTYEASFAGQGAEGEGITLSVVALDQLPALETAVSNLGIQNQAALAKSGQPIWQKLARARSGAEEYGKKSTGEEGDKLYDLHHLSQTLQRNLPGTDTARSADAVMAAIKNAVLYNKHGRGRPNANGISIYFPAEKEGLTDKPFGKSDYTHTSFATISKWYPFLTVYTGAEATDTTAPEIDNLATNDTDLENDDVATVTADVKADDVDEVEFVLIHVEDGVQTVLGALPTEPDEKGHLKETWDGQWFTIGDKDKELVCPITAFEEIDAEQDKYWVVVPAEVRLKGTDQWFEVSLYFSTDFNDEEVTGEFVYAFEDTRHGPRQVDLEKGDEIRPVYYTIDSKGEEHFEASDDKDDILILDDEGLTVGRDGVDKGDYRIGFVVTDLAGNKTVKFTDVKMTRGWSK